MHSMTKPATATGRCGLGVELGAGSCSLELGEFNSPSRLCHEGEQGVGGDDEDDLGCSFAVFSGFKSLLIFLH